MTSRPLKRILLVEDEPDIQMVTRMALEVMGGFKVCICDSGSEAIETAPAFAPDLILLDVMMPDMDGPGTFQALRKLPQTAAIPVIFMTAKVQPHEIAEYKALGALGVIAKPFDPATVSSAIHDLWAQHNG